MQFVSRLALGLALAGSAAIVAPALAKDKQPAAAQPGTGLKLTPAFVKAAKPAQDAVNAGTDLAAADPLVTAAEGAATNDDEKYLAAQIRLVLEQKKSNAFQTANPGKPVDRTGLVKPLDAMIANPRTPAADRAKFEFFRGAFAYEARQYPAAIDLFTRARDHGYTDPDLGLMLVKAKIEGGDVAGGTAELDKEVQARTAAWQKAPDDWYRYAIAQSNKQHLKPQTMTWLTKYAAAYPSPKTWYEVLATYGLQQDAVSKLDNQQKIDVFRLMRATGGLADQYFYIEYAQKVQNAGLPTEAQAVIKEGLANGKIPAANTEAKAMLTETAKSIQLEGSLASLEAKAKAPSATASLTSQNADAFLGLGNYAKAAELYRLALAKPGVDTDTVNTRLGIALARSGDKAGAQAAFAQVKGTPRTEIAQLWTTYLGVSPAA